MNGAIPPLPQYVFMTWCLVKQRDNFTLPYLPKSTEEADNVFQRYLFESRSGHRLSRVPFLFFLNLSILTLDKYFKIGHNYLLSPSFSFTFDPVLTLCLTIQRYVFHLISYKSDRAPSLGEEPITRATHTKKKNATIFNVQVEFVAAITKFECSSTARFKPYGHCDWSVARHHT
jgi:hypothetical protein